MKRVRVSAAATADCTKAAQSAPTQLQRRTVSKGPRTSGPGTSGSSYASFKWLWCSPWKYLKEMAEGKMMGRLLQGQRHR